ncbi:MAG: prepilin-type N-terminal cleavage/methylation domain-containing protein [Chthoniobacteraceae bacterium]|nr:prepilin-type N-terminal cleavage/methylation domain-containing protein [Chthoniobacteraceae bacterium]
MASRCFHIRSGFTLLEVILAIMIALVVMAVAIPSVTSALGESKAQKSFAEFDAMVREAHRRSVAEHRNYVIVWGRDNTVSMRPEEPGNRAEAEGLQRRKMTAGGEVELRLPAALTANGAVPDAIWTFWTNGVCEPAEVRSKGRETKWSAVYNPFTARAEVRYE